MANLEIKPGFIFRELHKKNPATLTLKEIHKFIFNTSPKIALSHNSPVPQTTGNVFPVEEYDIDMIFNKALKGL
ncbi:hypothetical protein HZA55_07105 [Candidatus Poribacteria bacterium]|nr:hypothetical protein [Candidatus Poribacteria bacterium]